MPSRLLWACLSFVPSVEAVAANVFFVRYTGGAWLEGTTGAEAMIVRMADFAAFEQLLSFGVKFASGLSFASSFALRFTFLD